MEVILFIVTFFVGLLIGVALLWIVCQQRLEEVRQNERNVALADIRVADERANNKESEITRLQEEVEEKEEEIENLTKDIVRLEREQALLTNSFEKDKTTLQEKIEFLNNTQETFKRDFTSIAAEALKNNNKEFKMLCNPVQETLNQINTKIEVVDSTAKNLGVETSKLVKALQKPEVRGKWGEVALERVLEIAGLCEGRDFNRQQSFEEDGSQLRPDYIINMPGKKHLAIDAKAPIRAFLEAAEAIDDDSKQLKLKEFLSHVRERVKKLSGKSYHECLPNSPEFVVLYLPTEAIICAALTLDIDLLESAFNQKVLVAGPTNLLALLLAVNHGWKQEALAESAKEIAELGKELHKRLGTLTGHVVNVGNHLGGSVKAYNEFIGSLERMVMPQARKFRDYGITNNKELPDLIQVEAIPKALKGPDYATLDTDGQIENPTHLARPR